MSDVMLERLRGQECHLGRKAVDVIAIGTIDGCSRYLHGDEGVASDRTAAPALNQFHDGEQHADR